MLVKLSTTSTTVQLCHFLCCFMQLFIYLGKKNTCQYIKMVMISGQIHVSGTCILQEISGHSL